MKPTPNLEAIRGYAELLIREISLGTARKTRSKTSAEVSRILAKREMKIKARADKNNLGR